MMVIILIYKLKIVCPSLSLNFMSSNVRASWQSSFTVQSFITLPERASPFLTFTVNYSQHHHFMSNPQRNRLLLKCVVVAFVILVRSNPRT